MLDSHINNCCETHIHLLRVGSRSFMKHITTELFLFFYRS